MNMLIEIFFYIPQNKLYILSVALLEGLKNAAEKNLL